MSVRWREHHRIGRGRNDEAASVRRAGRRHQRKQTIHLRQPLEDRRRDCRGKLSDSAWPATCANDGYSGFAAASFRWPTKLSDGDDDEALLRPSATPATAA
jgi:hypothetical protein